MRPALLALEAGLRLEYRDTGDTRRARCHALCDVLPSHSTQRQHRHPYGSGGLVAGDPDPSGAP